MTTQPSAAVIRNERLISATPQRIFAAFENPAELAQWWGPSGFTNTFQIFEFRPDGRWIFVMHGPNGVDYPNESVFRVLIPGAKVVIEHVAAPWFRLTVTLTPRGDQTHLNWEQDFEKPEVADRLRPICEPSNEQNLDRLESVLAGERQ